jgi:hypothetical protein
MQTTISEVKTSEFLESPKIKALKCYDFLAKIDKIMKQEGVYLQSKVVPKKIFSSIDEASL